jgi:hypothetical protein
MIQSLVFNTVYAQTTFTVTITTACEFDEGDDPGDFNECLTFPNGATITTDNVHFTARSSLPADQFICTLQREGILVPSPGNADNLCTTTSSLTAQATYIDLERGNYLFTVTAIRETTNPNGVQEEEESREASYRFTVLGAGDVGAGGLEAEKRVAPGDANVILNENEKRILTKINPIWASCDPGGFGKIVTEEGGQTKVEDSDVSSSGARLSAMKYLLSGDFSFGDLIQGLKKQGVNEFVVEIYTNFISRVITAEVYPVVKDIPKIISTSDLYKLDPFILTDSTVPRDKSDVPNRIPFKVQSVDTKCIYEAPDIATSQEIGGPFTRITPTTFLASNPPFQTCGADSESATYKITFSVKELRSWGIDSSRVQFQIVQQIKGLDPQYTGVLSFEPFHKDEKSITQRESYSNRMWNINIKRLILFQLLFINSYPYVIQTN